jgi:hypothetical protein
MTASRPLVRALSAAALGAVVCALAMPAHAFDIRIDLANYSAPPAGNWNTVMPPTSGGNIANLIDFGSGLGTGVSLSITQNFSDPGWAGNPWTGPPAFRPWVDSNASNDYVYRVNATGEITFSGSGIDPSETYRLEALASRNTTAANRRGDYRVNGALSDSLNSDGYHAHFDGYAGHQVMTWRQVKPDAAGNIVFDMASHLTGDIAYLSAMRLTDDAPPQSVLLDLGDTGRQTPGNWNNAYTTNGGGGTGGAGHRVVGAVDAAGQQTAVSFNILDDFHSRNADGVNSDAAGYPATAQSDSFPVYTGNTATLQVEGLTPGLSYDITLFGSRIDTGETRTAAFTVGGTTQTLVNTDNAANTVTFYDVTADSQGHIQVDTSVAAGSYAYLGVVEVVGSFSDEPAYPSIFFDFGSGASGYPTAGDWNNVTSSGAGLRVTDAIDSLGQPTLLDLRITDGFPATNTLGDQSNDAGFPISAQRDSFVVIAGGDETAQIQLEGLVAANTYDLTLFGSRRNSDAPGGLLSLDVTIDGLTQSLVNRANTANVLTFHNVQPDASGNILIDFGLSPNATFGYFGAMSVTYVAPEPGTMLLLGAGLLGLLRRRRR